jgi:hypothetical protein
VVDFDIPKTGSKGRPKVDGFLRPFEEKLEVVFVRNGPTSDF